MKKNRTIMMAVLISTQLIACGGSGSGSPQTSTASTTTSTSTPTPTTPTPSPSPSTPTFAEIHAVVENRCLSCHSAVSGTMAGFQQSGLAFDTPAQIAANAQTMNSSIQSLAMPLNNSTNMTTDERAAFNTWVKAGANIND